MRSTRTYQYLDSKKHGQVIPMRKWNERTPKPKMTIIVPDKDAIPKYLPLSTTISKRPTADATQSNNTEETKTEYDHYELPIKTTKLISQLDRTIVVLRERSDYNTLDLNLLGIVNGVIRAMEHGRHINFKYAERWRQTRSALSDAYNLIIAKSSFEEKEQKNYEKMVKDHATATSIYLQENHLQANYTVLSDSYLTAKATVCSTLPKNTSKTVQKQLENTTKTKIHKNSQKTPKLKIYWVQLRYCNVIFLNYTQILPQSTM